MLEKLPRILIVDACIFFSFFKQDSDRRRIIEELSNLGCRLISPEFVFEELAKNEERIKKFGKINELGFAFSDKMLEAMQLNFKDFPYLALALKLSCPIFSWDKGLKQQSRVKLLSPAEALSLIYEQSSSTRKP